MGELTGEVRRVGRPPGTTESIESLAKKSAQRDLKLLEKVSTSIEAELTKLNNALDNMSITEPAYLPLGEYRAKLKDMLIKNISATARIASTDPAKASEGDGMEAGLRETLAQLKGDG